MRIAAQVHLLGKPASVIYETAMEMLGLPADQVLAVGDSIEHDVAGAQSAPAVAPSGTLI